MTPHRIMPIAFAALLFGGGCRPAKTPNAGQAPPPPAVTVQQPMEREQIDWDEYPGRLEAVEMVEVRARVEGYLHEIDFKDGAEVKKGDLLFVIDPRPYQAALDRAQADLNQAKTKLELAGNEFERAERLLKSKAISEEEADTRNKARREAEAAVQSAQATVEVAKLNLEYTRITAPVSGRIGQRMMTVGNLISQSAGNSSMLATIVSLDPIYAYFDAEEGAVLKYQQLARSQGSSAVPVRLGLSNESGFPHEGVLDFMDNRVDPNTGTMKLRGKLANPSPRILQPGFFARVRVPGSKLYRALLIPSVAIGTDQGQKFVSVVDEKNVVQYRRVVLGPEDGPLRVIREGLKSGEWVIVNGLMAARPGMTVAPQKAVAGSSPKAAAKP